VEDLYKNIFCVIQISRFSCWDILFCLTL